MSSINVNLWLKVLSILPLKLPLYYVQENQIDQIIETQSKHRTTEGQRRK